MFSLLRTHPSVLESNNYVALDFETTNLDFGDPVNTKNRLVVACWVLGRDHPNHYDGNGFAHWGGELEQGRLLEHIAQAKYIIAHNAKFELGWLLRAGVNLRNVLPACTMLAEYVMAGNRMWELSLDAVSARYGIGHKHSYIKAMIEAGHCVTTLPHDQVQDYCLQDARLCERLWLIQREKLRREHLLPDFYERNILTPMYVDMESRGLPLDASKVKEKRLEVEQIYDKAVLALDEFTGGVNFRSGKQMAKYLYEDLEFEELKDRRGNPIRTDGNQPKTGKETILALECANLTQEQFVGLVKPVIELKGTMEKLDKMQTCINDDGGILYGNINQGFTQTHRSSSTGKKYGFQLQNFPRILKPLFCTRSADLVVCEGDCRQLEFRSAIDLAHDEAGLADILARVDVHQVSAQHIGVPRQEAKAFTFKPLFNGRSGTKRQRDYYAYFRNRYKRLNDTQEGWCREVVRTKRLRTHTGFTFYWPHAQVTPSGYVEYSTQIYNYPIQKWGTGDISQLSVLILWHLLPEDWGYLVLQVHDSGIGHILREHLDKYKQLVVKSFTILVYDLVEMIYGHKIWVPLGVEMKTGTHWGKGEEEQHESALFMGRFTK